MPTLMKEKLLETVEALAALFLNFENLIKFPVLPQIIALVSSNSQSVFTDGTIMRLKSIATSCSSI